MLDQRDVLPHVVPGAMDRPYIKYNASDSIPVLCRGSDLLHADEAQMRHAEETPLRSITIDIGHDIR